jgi:hypothetical protein
LIWARTVDGMNIGPVEILVTIAMVGLLLAALLWGNRPTPARFAAANGLTLDDETRAEVRAALRRTYRGRVLGGSASFVIAVAFGVATGTDFSFTRGLAAVLAGTLVGIALAQFTPAPAPGAVRVASLDARDVDDYRPRRAKVVLGVALGILLGYSVSFLAFGATGAMVVIVPVVALAGIAVVVLGGWIQRRIVEQARARVDEDQARVDDALRASAVRAVHHATVGILLCGIAFVGITGARWGPIDVEVAGETRFQLAPGASDVVTGGERIWWTDFSGDRHARVVPRAVGHITGWHQRSESPAVSIVGAFLALLAGVGAVLEWREAARAWRRPRPTRPAPDHPQLAPTGGAT